MSIQIKTAAVTGPKTCEILELTTPDLGRGEVLVKVHAVALCTLEQRIFRGEVKMPLPCTGGHEVAGEIAALGPGVNTKLWAEGQRVAVRLLYNCGECYYCRTGRTNMCERAQKKPVREGLLPGPGGLCDYIVVDAASLFKIPDTLTYEEACLTEPLACCVHSVGRADIQLGEDVVIIGGGIMGQYHVMLAKRKGARVILSEVDPARRVLAENLGADITLNPMEQDPVEFVKGITDGRGADVVFNTTAIPNAMVGYGSVVAIAFLVSEVKNPNRTVPKSMAISMVLVVLLYLLMIIATMGNITTQLLIDNPGFRFIPMFAAAFTSLTSVPWLSKLISIAALLALLTTMLVVLSLNARAVSSMADGGMLPKPLAKLNKNGVPGTATVTLAIICMVLSCFPSLTELLVNLGSVSAAITIVIVCASLICARKKVPHQAGNYKAPGGNFISVLTIVLIVASYIPGIFSGGGTMWLFTIIIYAVGAVIMAYYLKKQN